MNKRGAHRERRGRGERWRGRGRGRGEREREGVGERVEGGGTEAGEEGKEGEVCGVHKRTSDFNSLLTALLSSSITAAVEGRVCPLSSSQSVRTERLAS